MSAVKTSAMKPHAMKQSATTDFSAGGARPPGALDCGSVVGRERANSDQTRPEVAFHRRATARCRAKARVVGLIFAIPVFAHAAAETAPAKLSAQDMQFFERKIRPVLIDNCYKCHSREGDKVKGGLLLDSRAGWMAGGNSGFVVTPGKPEESLLIKAIGYADEDLQMPPKGKKLSDQQIADLTEWVRRGAPDPRGSTTGAAASGGPGGVGATHYGGVGKQHWSFQPVKAVAPPVVKNAAWCQTPVDNFILAKLEASGMAPNPAAEKRTLLRRVTFALIGLPPTEDEVRAFLADGSPGAFAKVVDRLLASPHYGERWGRYWLDVARYSDTQGEPKKRMDPRFPHAWTYRDYVIDALNQDKPYNQFIVEQLAADRLLAETARKAKGEKAGAKSTNAKAATAVSAADQATLAAMGFLTLGPQYEGNIHDIVNDRIDVTSKAFLGLTVACARCHDHKFDPIPTKDYYSLYGIFASSTVPKELPTVRPVPRTPELTDYLAKLEELQQKEAELTKEFAEFRRTRTRDAEKRREFLRRQTTMSRELGELESNHPGVPPRANALVDAAKPKDFPVLIRGEAQNIGEVAPRRFLEVLSPNPKNRPLFTSGSGRLELARAIADPKNPLTARVLVNRVWQQHFGAGFVATPDDLGNMSSTPTHPELLDYLADRFVKDGWSLKKLHRLIVLSAVYQVSGEGNAAYAERDPDNTLLWRANLRRLDFEELHDALLAMADTLDPEIGGKSLPLGSEGFATRRSLYVNVDRRNPPELLTQFDYPNPNVPSGKRYSTLVPQQSLFLMNSALVIETARKLVHRPEFLELASDEARVASLYEAIFQRPPQKQETKACLSYIKANPGGASTDAPALGARGQAMVEQNTRAARREARIAEQMAKSPRKNAYQPEPGGAAFKDRAPLDAWSKLAHALFQTNEAMFVE